MEIEPDEDTQRGSKDQGGFTDAEKRILFELKGISHLVSEISTKLVRLTFLTDPSNGIISHEQNSALSTLETWKQLFAQHETIKKKEQTTEGEMEEQTEGNE